MDHNNQTSLPSLPADKHIDILLEEYRALYRLLLFRLEALDRRLPMAGGLLAAVLAGVGAMPDDVRVSVLGAVPMAVLWLTHTAVHHARSKEDHLRRIDELERAVNALAGADLLVFQSQHPARALVTAGRSGHGTVVAIAASGLVLLALCLFLWPPLRASRPGRTRPTWSPWAETLSPARFAFRDIAMHEPAGRPHHTYSV